MERSIKRGFSKGLTVALAAIFAVVVAVGSAYAEPPKKKPGAAPAPAGPDLYSSVWKKVRPNPKAHPNISNASAVAGLRGEEKSKYLRPYWKGEKKNETPDAAAFREAGKLIDGSEYEKALAALTVIMTQYPASPLVPKVKLAIGVCYAQLGRKDDAGKTLADWLNEYPTNEMAPEVKIMLADLRK